MLRFSQSRKILGLRESVFDNLETKLRERGDKKPVNGPGEGCADYDDSMDACLDDIEEEAEPVNVGEWRPRGPHGGFYFVDAQAESPDDCWEIEIPGFAVVGVQQTMARVGKVYFRVKLKKE